ncbi:hypothetical protein LCGC14_0514880 [marine sediment metagenome]|uniref:Uncharacterized protein n=1 Tax=marine sediment metagenome TaxID=412755 RepID=A0A0F9SII1_9ZZZZ|nr:hypothetical protein [Candidatus Aminicenantes bacterium]
MSIRPEDMKPDPDLNLYDMNNAPLDDNHDDCWGYDGVFAKSADLDRLWFMFEGLEMMPLWERTVGRNN